MQLRNKLVLGLDGGGTKTTASVAVVDENARLTVLGSATNGPSNILSVGQERALNNLNNAIEAALSKAQVPRQKMDYTVFGLAGSSSSDVRALLTTWAEHRELSRQFEIVSDIDPVMMAGTPHNRGVALIVGTGTVVKGVTLQGNTQILGGWGHWYGDQGSGFDLGRQALIASVQYVDGIGPETCLLENILNQLKINDPKEIIVTMERTGDVRGQISALAKLVLETAATGDDVARNILKLAVTHIAALVKSLTSRLPLEQEFPLALAGGVVCGSELFRESLMTALEKNEISTSVISLVPIPVDGCLKLAQLKLHLEALNKSGGTNTTLS